MIPVTDHVIVKLNEPVTETEGGIHIPQVAQVKPVEAIVVAVGPGRMNAHGVLIGPEVEIGDRVIIHRYSGHEFTCGGEYYVNVEHAGILAKIK